jgi:hypothetical protein
LIQAFDIPGGIVGHNEYNLRPVPDGGVNFHGIDPKGAVTVNGNHLPVRHRQRRRNREWTLDVPGFRKTFFNSIDPLRSSARWWTAICRIQHYPGVERSAGFMRRSNSWRSSLKILLLNSGSVINGRSAMSA